MTNFSFQTIPKDLNEELNLNISKIDNECLKSTFQNTNFLYLISDSKQDEENLKKILIDTLKKYNFFVYDYSNFNTDTQIADLIICNEDFCLIIESINTNLTEEILKKFGSKINSSSFDDHDDIDIFFFNFFDQEIENELINTIFRTVSCYLIRRFYYPTHYFKNPSFFQFKNEKHNTYEMKFKEKMSKILFSNQKEEIDNLFSELIDEIKQNKDKEQENPPFYEFKNDDFFVLRKVSVAEKVFNLVIEVNTLHLFWMAFPNSNRDISFCEKYSHPCFARCYGFVKENNRIKKIIYEYMCNDNLNNFITKKGELIDETLMFLMVYRIYRGIEFLKSNSLVHRDLKPANILIDHDFIPYIGDFEFIRPVDDGFHSTKICGSGFYASPEVSSFSKISFSSDIYSFGLIIYFIYERKNMIDSNEYFNYLIDTEYKNIKKMEKGTENIKEIYNSSIIYDQNERITIENVKEKMLNEYNSFYYLDKYFIKEIKQNLYSIIIQYIFENAQILNSNELNQFFDHIYEFVLLKLEPNIEEKNQSSLINIGDKHYYKSNYKKAYIYYELASNLNNSDGYLYLADLFDKGNGVVENKLKAKELYEKSAKLHNPKSFFNLGNIYLYGFDIVNVNIKTAIEYYERAAELDNPNALDTLGQIYLKGERGVEKNYEKAKKYFEKLVEKNDPKALLLLGYMYECGFGVDKDISKAEELYLLSAKQNYPEAFNYLGSLYYLQKKFVLSADNFKLAIKHGYTLGYNNLGLLYMNGLGVKQNYEEAFKNFSFALKNNDFSVLVNIGVLYLNGYGVKQNFEEAKRCFLFGSAFFPAESYHNLGVMYYNGLGVEQNYEEAFRYFKKSSDYNYSQAIFNISNMYYFGQGVKQDYSKARQLYQLLAEQNDSKALFNLGCIYLYGQGVNKNDAKAYECFSKSAQNGNVKAYLILGHFYFYGIGVQKDINKAIHLFEKVSNLNDPDGSLNLGFCYYFGKGVEVDYSKAFNFFQLSAKSDNPLANTYLGICYFKGNGVERDIPKSIEYFQSSAAQNNELALLLLGCLHLNGYKVQKNLKLAKKYLKLSANQNNKHAQLNLGQIYLLGIGGTKKYLKALKYFESSANQNNTVAYLYLGCIYLYGYGIKKDFDKAKKYFDLGCNINDPISNLLLGNYFSMTGNHSEAIKLYERSANYNNSDALFNLGNIYLSANYYNSDPSKALYYFEKSANLNNSFAFLQIGNIYFNGSGVKQSYEKAKYYYEKSAELRNSDAILNIGILYSFGLGVEKDFTKAKYYYEQSTLFNNPSAYFHLGACYLLDKNDKLNQFKSLQCFLISAKHNNPSALFYLGYFYSNDDIYGFDIDKSIEYFTKCTTIENDLILNYDDKSIYSTVTAYKYNQYLRRSMNDLGLLYLIEKNDYEKAINLIKNAAFAEYPCAQNNYGLLLEFNSNDIAKAEHFYERSTEHNFALGYFNLGRLNEEKGKINEAVDFYMKASKYENEPLMFNNFRHYDKRLVISITFVICFTNLKLSHYYFSQSNFDESKYYFIKAFDKLIIHESILNYKFSYKYEEHQNAKDLFIYLRNFIFNFPLFNLKNQPNLNLDLDFNNNNNNNDLPEPKIPETNKNDSDDSIDQKNNFFKEKMIKLDLINNFSDSSDDDLTISPNSQFSDNDENTFDSPKKLFEFIILNDKLKTVFLSEINEILHQIEEILKTEPRNILFGRIVITRPKQTETVNPLKKNINESFYEGFI